VTRGARRRHRPSISRLACSEERTRVKPAPGAPWDGAGHLRLATRQDRYPNCYQSPIPTLPSPTRRARYLHNRRSRARRTSGGWGIRTPEGFHPTRFPSASTGGGKRSPLYVPAGQRGARMVRATPGSSWIGKNCYRNCYQGRARATARQSRVGHHGSGVALDAPTGPRPIAGRPELVGRSGDRLRVEPDAVAAVVAARAVRVGARGGTEDRQ